MKYRADIDGLRAIAVLSVVGYHAFPAVVRGGFVGVDIFFVISGYLISRIIIEGLQRDRFSFADFYARRIRRIFPALLIVLVACYAAGWFLLFADAFMQLGKHIAAGAGFVSNYAFSLEAGYFDGIVDTKPLLHLWSLAVEEQFYLVWPLAAFLVYRARLDLLAFAALILTASMAWNMWTIRVDLVGPFYSPLTRFWELMAGATLAAIESDASGLAVWLRTRLDAIRSTSVARDLMETAAVLLIAGSVMGIDRTRHFPGAWALLPVAGAWLAIAAGPDAIFNRSVLARRVVVAIGLISYPLYLWHWPLLTFARLVMNETPPVSIRLAAIAASIVLAWLTYVVVEKPIRFGKRRALVVPSLVSGLAVMLVAGLFTYQRHGLWERPVNRSDKAHFVDYYATMRKEGIAAAYRSECDFNEWGTEATRASIAPECTAPGPRATFLLWGDSFAQALSAGIRSILPDGSVLAQVATSHCRPSIVPIDLDVPGGRCKRANDYALETIQRLKPDLVILAQMGAHQETDWNALGARLRQLGAKDVLLVGPTPHWAPSLPEVVAGKYWGGNYDRVSYGLAPEIFEVDRALAAQLRSSSSIRYVSALDRLCNADGCIATVPGSNPPELVAFDYGHLTPRGSRFVAEVAIRPALQR